jgi:urease accessory protein
MKRAIEAVARGDWPLADTVGSVTLDYDARHRRRIRLDCADSGPVLLDLEHAVALQAAEEDLVEIQADTAHSLHRIAWHLGNRHCPAEIHADRIYIRRDHVIEAMLEGLGVQLVPVKRPFDPEGGAYAEGHGHGA